jgi:hypothetical protein
MFIVKSQFFLIWSNVLQRFCITKVASAASVGQLKFAEQMLEAQRANQQCWQSRFSNYSEIKIVN